MASLRSPASFSRYLSVTAALIIVMAVALLLLIRSGRQISAAHVLRYESYLLADELRQSSDDLTRMVHLYVATGNPTYKQFYEDILDIREGLKPRPFHYHRIYWDFLLPHGQQPTHEGASAISLVKLMKQAGFTHEEMRKLEEAKAKSDKLTAVEFEAIKLVDVSSPEKETNRARALEMLTSKSYQQAKAGIMQPIDDFFGMLDERTLAVVKSAERTASIIDYGFFAIVAALTCSVVLTFVTLHKVLGGPLDQINSRIARIGRSDECLPSNQVYDKNYSILSWLTLAESRLDRILAEQDQMHARLSQIADLSEQSFDAIIVWDWNGAITFWNTGAEQMYGIPKAEAIGRVTHELLQTRHPLGMHGFLRQLEQSGHWTSELEHSTRDGRRILVETRMRLVKRESSSYVIETNRDITERHKAASIDRRLATIVTSTNDAVISKSLDGIITSWNPGAERIFGFTSREIVGSPMTMLFPPDLLDEEKRILAFVSQDTRIEPFETVRRHANGSLVHVSVSISPIKDADGRIVEATTIARDITDRKQAERDLRESNERFYALALATSEMIWSTDSDGQVIGSLEKWQEYTGQSNDEIQGGGWVNALHPEDTDRAMAAWQEAVAGKSLYKTEYRLRRYDGIYRQFLVRGVPVLKPDGTIREWIGTCVDVEDLTVANKSLAESEERLRLALDAAQMGTFDWDMIGDRIVWSKWHLILWNYTPEEFNGTFDAFAERVHPDDLTRIHTAIDHSVASRSRFACEFRVVWPDRSIHWVDATGEFEFGSDGKPFRMMGTVFEITDQKQAELERDRFFTLSLDPLCIADTNGYFRRLNPAFQRILGFSIEEMLSRPFVEFIHPEDLPATMKVVESLASGIELVNFENRYLCKDGSHRWFTWTCAPYQEEGLLYASARDITERKRAELALLTLNRELEDRVRKRTAELETSNKELEAFSYSVSHDLRAPLRSVDSFSRIAIEDYGPQLGDEGMRVLNIVRSEAQRMGQLIDDLLSFSRFARQEMRVTSIDMAELARNVFEAMPEESRLHIKQFTIDPMPTAFGDPAMLRQVWHNLISNAVKFTKSQPEAAIRIRGQSFGGLNQYTIKDNGVGFDPRYKHKLFGVFQRLHTEDEFEGTGVGLALIQRIIFRHGGEVEAEGQPDRGAMFTFLLPNQESS